jgi:hypothetical protein
MQILELRRRDPPRMDSPSTDVSGEYPRIERVGVRIADADLLLEIGKLTFVAPEDLAEYELVEGIGTRRIEGNDLLAPVFLEFPEEFRRTVNVEIEAIEEAEVEVEPGSFEKHQLSFLVQLPDGGGVILGPHFELDDVVIDERIPNDCRHLTLTIALKFA